MRRLEPWSSAGMGVACSATSEGSGGRDWVRGRFLTGWAAIALVFFESEQVNDCAGVKRRGGGVAERWRRKRDNRTTVKGPAKNILVESLAESNRDRY